MGGTARAAARGFEVNRAVTPLPGLTSAQLAPAGSHVCWVVDDAENYIPTAASLLSEAARFGERPIVLTPAGREEELRALRFPVELAVDPAAHFLGGGPLDPAAMVRVFREQTEQARATGYRGVRLVADMAWLHATRADAASIAAYETHVEHVAAELGATIICAYRRSSVPAVAVEAALTVHSGLCGYDAAPRFRFVANGPGEWRLNGEVDFSVSELFAAAFRSAVKLGNCAVDLRGLRFIDVSGVRAIVTAAADADRPVELRNPGRLFRRYWELCAFSQARPNVHLAGAPRG